MVISEFFRFMQYKICITLDYELCLGKNTGTVLNTIIKPMNELSSIFDRYNVKVTLFVDSSYLLALKKQKSNFPVLEEDYRMIVNQLQELNSKGHSIQLHIHPQWIYSYFDGSKWNLDFKHYKLSDLDKKVALIHFNEAKELLESIIEKEVVAFRAGGFSLQSFKNYYEMLFINNIKIDSSVVPLTFEQSEYQWYDYKSAPLHPYLFFDDILIPSKEGKICEVPISVIKYNPFYYAYLKKKTEFNTKFNLFSEGQGIGLNKSKWIRMYSQFKQLFRTKIMMASIDGFSSVLLPMVFDDYKKNNRNNDNFIVIGHPKSASPNSIMYVNDFINKTYQNNSYITIENFK